MNRLVSLSLVALVLASNITWGQVYGNSEFSVYRVDAEDSDIRLMIHRAGALSWMGHSHVISVRQLDGTIYVHPDLEKSHFELVIPVQELIVDDPLLRRQEGDEFSTRLSESDIAGTRSNMLGKGVLDAKRYPIVRLTGTGPKGDGPDFMLGFNLEILGNVVEIRIPLNLQLDGDKLEATGAFQLSHSDLGMRPFSRMLGALRVADALNFKYRIRALRIRTKEGISEDG